MKTRQLFPPGQSYNKNIQKVNKHYLQAEAGVCNLQLLVKEQDERLSPYQKKTKKTSVAREQSKPKNEPKRESLRGGKLFIGRWRKKKPQLKQLRVN